MRHLGPFKETHMNQGMKNPPAQQVVSMFRPLREKLIAIAFEATLKTADPDDPDEVTHKRVASKVHDLVDTLLAEGNRRDRVAIAVQLRAQVPQIREVLERGENRAAAQLCGRLMGALVESNDQELVGIAMGLVEFGEKLAPANASAENVGAFCTAFDAVLAEMEAKLAP